MDISLYYPCDRCGAMPIYGELIVRAEVHRVDRLWATSKTIERHGLCRPCFDRIASAATAAAQGIVSPAWPGLPPQVETAPSDYAHCNFCRSSLPPQAIGVDIVPMTTEFVRRSLYRHHGSIQQHRVCRQCYAWTMTLIREDPEVRGYSRRAYEAGLATWYEDVARDTWVCGLIERDATIIKSVCQQASRAYRPIELADIRFLPHTGTHVAFLEAGQGRALRALKALPEAERARVIVIARPDTIEEAMDALALGAGDVAVSPLSREQVAGSFERVGDIAQRQRHAPTGMAIYADDEPGAYGLPSNTLEITLPRAETIRNGFLRLRRFLRGYDRVGVSTNGALRAVVYSPCEYAPRIVDRIQMAIGEGTTVRVVGQGAARTLPRAESAA